MLEVVAEGIVAVNEHGTIVFANAAAVTMFGWSREELVGQPMDRLVPPLQREVHGVHRQAYAAEPRVRAMGEGRILVGCHRDGTELPIEAQLSPMQGPDGRWVIASIRDATAAVELERLRNEWISVIAHDLRQPIHGVRLLAQMLRRHVTKAPELVMRDVEGIIELVDRLTRMVSDLLELSRLDARRLTLEWSELDLVELVHASVPRYPLADAALRVEVDGEIPRIEADPQRLTQVLDKLLSNAVKLRAPATPIAVRIARGGERVVVEVSHEGPAIAPEDLQRLFKRFQWVVGATPESSELGVGLQIARGLVEAHGGELSAHSEPGRDTVFRFTLPLRRMSPPSRGESRSGRRTIG